MRGDAASSIIEALGGKAAVRTRVGAKRQAVNHWTRNGIPARYWPDVIAMAAELGVEWVTFDTLQGKDTPVAEPAAA